MGISRDTGGRFRNAVVIAGPTASGKSALAVELAERLGGTVVNADSMQVYSILKVLTARPEEAELARVPHALYGHVHPATPYSTGNWMRDVSGLLPESDGPKIFVGGTGLYLRALTQGISEMPDIPDEIRQGVREKLAEKGSEGLHAVLSRVDPAAARVLRPSDRQRVARALEVVEASGRSIVDWQGERGEPLIDTASARFVVLEPERGDLIAHIDSRFHAMMTAGAFQEVETLAGLGIDPALPAMRAIGVRELMEVLSGKITLSEAVSLAVIASRQYAKRQSTWFRHQLGPQWRRFPNKSMALESFNQT